LATKNTLAFQDTKNNKATEEILARNGNLALKGRLALKDSRSNF
jgi:hypothetical protein